MSDVQTELESQAVEFVFPLIKSSLSGVIRHAISGFGAVLITDGYMSQSDETALVGAVIALLGIALSVGQKFLMAKLVKTAQGQSK